MEKTLTHNELLTILDELHDQSTIMKERPATLKDLEAIKVTQKVRMSGSLNEYFLSNGSNVYLRRDKTVHSKLGAKHWFISNQDAIDFLNDLRDELTQACEQHEVTLDELKTMRIHHHHHTTSPSYFIKNDHGCDYLRRDKTVYPGMGLRGEEDWFYTREEAEKFLAHLRGDVKIEISMQEIADKFGHLVGDIKITG